MSRAPRSTSDAVPAPVTIAPETADPATTEATVASTEPLPSDQISAPREVVSARAPVAAVPIAETAPLPVPGTRPEPDHVDIAEARSPLVRVDGTVPLPSDQLTPLVPVDAASAIAISQSKPLPASPEADGSDAQATVCLTDDAADRLRHDLESAGFGVVILAADTVDLLRDALGMKSLRPEQPAAEPTVDSDEERRSFPVVFDVEHDGRRVGPGGLVKVVRAEFERLLKGTAIAHGTRWRDGETS